MKKDYKGSQQSHEEELDFYIDALNLERRPEEGNEAELAELQVLVRKVKGLGPQQEPSKAFTSDLQQKLLNYPSQNSGKTFPSKKRILPWGTLVASVLVLILLISPWSNTDKNIVLAMEQSVKQLKNYHGTLEKISTNAKGERQVLQRTEIWSEGNKYTTRSEDGITTVNSGELHWKTEPQRKEVVLLPIYLDPHDFDLQKESARAQKYPYKIVGEDSISGRTATRLEITPPGGLSYLLWIDTETHLPIQLQTAMQKSLQTTYTFVSLETNINIPDTLFKYNPPEGYHVVDQNPNKLMNTLDEAIRISGLTPKQTLENPQRIFASRNQIVFDYEDTIVIQSKVNAPLVIDPLAALGQVEEGPLEILPGRLRWQQNNLEIAVQGKRTAELAKEITKNIDFSPQSSQILPTQPSVKIENDLEVVKRNQQQVDSGSSPWQLDPLQVAFTFASLRISPEGINGEPPLDYESLKMVSNNGIEAVINISEGPTKTVYVKRLIRQDQTGIWTVVGYDPR